MSDTGMNNTDVKNTVVSDEHDLIIYQDGAIGRFHLNRPTALNALTAPMAYKMKDQLYAWAVDDSIKAILIDAAGDRAFCAGGDIRYLYENGKKDPKPGQDFWREEYKLNALINNFPKPYIAYMNGIVMGGGVGISSHGSHRIVTENTMLAMPETGIGFLPDVGGTYILSRSPGLTGLYLGMTGARMNAADAIFAGFADHFIPTDKLPLLTEKLINGANLDAAIAELASNAPDGTLAGLQADITEAFSGATALECTQKITAMAETGNAWAAKTLKLLRRHSPIAISAAFTAISEARSLDTIEQCLNVEYRFAHRALLGTEFYEGVKAIIIDKNHTPQWHPPTLEDVTADHLIALFAPLGTEEWLSS